MAVAPWLMDPCHEESGWSMRTEVKESVIPEAGRGRFTCEDVPAGTLVRRTRIVDVEGGGGEAVHCEIGTTLAFRDEAGLLAAMNFADQDGDGEPTNEEQIANFCGTPVGLDASNERVFCWIPSNFVNHGRGEAVNVEYTISEDGVYMVAHATRDIAAGEELMVDYTTFRNPAWFKEYCVRNDLVDTEALGHAIGS